MIQSAFERGLLRIERDHFSFWHARSAYPSVWYFRETICRSDECMLGVPPQWLRILRQLGAGAVEANFERRNSQPQGIWLIRIGRVLVRPYRRLIRRTDWLPCSFVRPVIYLSAFAKRRLHPFTESRHFSGREHRAVEAVALKISCVLDVELGERGFELRPVGAADGLPRNRSSSLSMSRSPAARRTAASCNPSSPSALCDRLAEPSTAPFWRDQ